MVASLCWWLFGWSRAELSTGTITFHRSLGSIVEVSVDVDGDGRPEDLLLFTRHDPYRHVDREVCQPGMQRFLDRDLDGVWDAWFTVAESEPGMVGVQIEVDTNFDSFPDWQFSSSCSELDRVMEGVLVGTPFPHERCSRAAPRSRRAAEVVCGWAERPAVLSADQASAFWRRAFDIQFEDDKTPEMAEELAAGLLPEDTSEWPPQFLQSFEAMVASGDSLHNAERVVRLDFWRQTWPSIGAGSIVARSDDSGDSQP